MEIFRRELAHFDTVMREEFSKTFDRFLSTFKEDKIVKKYQAIVLDNTTQVRQLLFYGIVENYLFVKSSSSLLFMQSWSSLSAHHHIQKNECAS